MYRSLQQSCNVTSPDVLMALDYCEESLQEIDVTSFLNTLCGHVGVFRERGGERPAPFTRSGAFTVRDGEEERAPFTSSSRYQYGCGPSLNICLR